MTTKLFIDGAAGTTGLEIRERLAGRDGLTLVQLSDVDRKDAQARRTALNDADIVILCLPDAAAREAVSLIANPAVRVIDASSAHRVAPDWVFGFPEIFPDGYERVAAAKRVSNPGCYSTGFLALAAPLVRAGLIPADFPFTVNAVSGYSGGGRSMIAEFEDKDLPGHTESVARTYALSLAHKHVPEMQVHAGLTHPPLFSPMVGRFYRGMMVEIPVQAWMLPGTPNAADFHAVLAAAYRERPFVQVASPQETAALGVLDVENLKDTDRLKLYVFANEKTQQLRLIALLDNLGKGAGGAAVQNLNIMLGLPETTGLL